jgi:hypothetical protein
VRVHRGNRLTRWQRGLASLPLVLAGAGGKVPEALKHSLEARRAVVIAALLAMLLVAATVVVGWLTLE